MGTQTQSFCFFFQDSSFMPELGLPTVDMRDTAPWKASPPNTLQGGISTEQFIMNSWQIIQPPPLLLCCYPTFLEGNLYLTKRCYWKWKSSAVVVLAAHSKHREQTSLKFRIWSNEAKLLSTQSASLTSLSWRWGLCLYSVVRKISVQLGTTLIFLLYLGNRNIKIKYFI
jgi:hypothetical protein